MEQKKEKIRIYIIADDYRWHFHTTDINELKENLGLFANTLEISEKENTYHLSSLFLTQVEYDTIKKNISYANKKTTGLSLVPKDS